MRRSISFLTLAVFVGSMYAGCESSALKGAKIYIQNSEIAKAKEQLIIATTNNPADFEAHYMLGQIFLKEGNYEKMNEHYDASLTASSSKQRQIEDDRLSAFTGIYGDAARYLNAGYEETDPEKKKLAFELSVKEMEKAYSIKPDSRALEGQAVAYYALEKDDEAERLFKKVLEGDPKNSNSLIQLGNMKFNKAEILRVDESAEKDLLDPLYTEALGYFQAYYEAYPDRIATVIASIAWCHQQLGDTEKAIGVYKRILDAEPDNIDIVVQLGILKYNMGDIDGAVVDFKSALDSRPDDYELLKTVGQTLWNNLIPKVNSITVNITKEEIIAVLPYIEKIVSLHEEDNDKVLSKEDEEIFTLSLFTLYNNLYKIEPSPELEKQKDDAFLKYSAALKRKG